MRGLQRKLVGNEYSGLLRPARKKGTDSLRRHDIHQAVRLSIPGGLRVLATPHAAARFRFGLVAASTFPFNTATGRCWNSAASGTSAAQPGTE
jgi:hypothetical protein